ncbi:MAG: gliding motility-associated C-terminal domain-containing protein, partial [Saprospiraceae bacterium]|nr:gliding motility-associated C-terminal domain-containing protein [Saprospiraceae bacterium]
DRHGQLKWAKQYDTMQIDQIRSRFDNDDLLVSGSWNGILTLARMRPDGSLVWVKRKVYPSGGYTLAVPYMSMDKQSIWLTALFNYTSEGQQDTTMLYKLDEAGNVLWGKGFWNCKYNFVYGGASTPDNGFALLWKHPQGTILTKINADGQLNNGCPEPQGSIFEWSTPTINITTFSVNVTDGDLPAAEVFEWESVTVFSQDFCPDERPEAFFEAPDSVCTGVPLYLTADTTSLADTYIWNVPAGTPSQSLGINDTLSFLQKGLHNIALIQQYGFCSDTFQRDVQAIGLTSPNLADTVFCNSNPFSVDVTNTDAISYLWNNGDTTSTRLFSQSGLYAVTISDANCVLQDSFTLTYFANPTLFLSPDTTVCEEATFIPSILPNEVSAWRWDGQITEPPFVFGNMNGLHILEVLFNNGCVASDSINVQIVDCSDDAPVYIPNAISLQENSSNRIFEIFAPNATPIQSVIYDRWGELLYSTSVGEWPQWDGTFRGRTVPAGVYVFACTLRFLDGSKKIFTRDITVVY